MEQIKVIGCGLTKMCRLCLSFDITTTGVFLFSSEPGKEIADIIMECVPIHITKNDKMPNYICRLCFTQLKKFHQFQMQVIQSDKKLQRYLQLLNDSHTEINLEWAFEESDNSVNQNSKADVTAKGEPVEISDKFDLCYTKQKVPTNLCAKNKNHEEIYLKSELKDEPMDNNLLISTECTDNTVESLSKGEDTVESLSKGEDRVDSLSKGEGSEIGGEDSTIVIGDTKVGVDTSEIFKYSLKFENGVTEKIPLKSKETSNKPLEEADSNIYTGEKPYQCAVCKMCFKQTVQLKRHALKHKQEKQYQCDVCKVGFKELSNLKRHQLIHTGKKPHQCDICKMCFRYGHHLRNHALTHTGEKPYQCDICKMGFRQAVHLKRHKLTHTEEKPFQCSICKLGFTESFSLRRHNLIHTGEKPHKCDICNKSFIQAFQLKRHKLKHTGEKPYQCDSCKKCFRHVTSLKCHELKHKGDKPYKCNSCKMCFRHPTTLKNHELTHTGEKPYQCDVCQMCFRQVVQLKRHTLKHKGKKSSKC